MCECLRHHGCDAWGAAVTDHAMILPLPALSEPWCSITDNVPYGVCSACDVTGDQPRLLTTMQPVRKGTHGGVTLLGLSGAAAGGLLAGVVFYCAAVLSPTLWVFEAQVGPVVDGLHGLCWTCGCWQWDHLATPHLIHMQPALRYMVTLHPSTPCCV